MGRAPGGAWWDPLNINKQSFPEEPSETFLFELLAYVEDIRCSGCFRLEAEELQITVGDGNAENAKLELSPGQAGSLLFSVRVPGNAADWSDVPIQ